MTGSAVPAWLATGRPTEIATEIATDGPTVA